MYEYNMTYPNELYHYGVKGMKWGVRRYQNADGSLTSAGQKKTQKLQSRLDRNMQNQSKADAKIMDARAKNRARLESKYDKKIAKYGENNQGRRQYLVDSKKFRLDDFDRGTENIKKAQKIGNENHNKFAELKIKSISDPSIKKSFEYKQAKKWCEAQILSEVYYGKPYTLLMEANSVAVNNGKSWTRGRLYE